MFFQPWQTAESQRNGVFFFDTKNPIVYLYIILYKQLKVKVLPGEEVDLVIDIHVQRCVVVNWRQVLRAVEAAHVRA